MKWMLVVALAGVLTLSEARAGDEGFCLRSRVFRGASLAFAFTPVSRALKPINTVCKVLLGEAALSDPPEAYFWTLGLHTADFEGQTVLDVTRGVSLFTPFLNVCFVGTSTHGISHSPESTLPIASPDGSVDLAISHWTMSPYLLADSLERGGQITRDIMRVLRPRGRFIFNVSYDFRAAQTRRLERLQRFLEELTEVRSIRVERSTNPFNGVRFILERA